MFEQFQFYVLMLLATYFWESRYYTDRMYGSLVPPIDKMGQLLAAID